ncbi:hypothetical protein L1049_002234 [Liquidambar formosana]|uniref:Uncharacterized protein n=1 Tax=Liquidambar formosana TaxID=63359 RepID=A0AAP0NJ29_LIQFO
MHSDSSFSLYPSLSPFSPSPLPPSSSQTQTLIPPPSSSSSFLLLRPNPIPNPSPSPNSPNPRVLFVVAGPHNGGATVLLRFYILRKTTQVFAKARVLCTQKELQFDDRLGVVVNVSHGVSVKLAASVNVLAMYSVSNSKIWVFAAKMAGDDDGDGVVVRLMKCAVIECSVPVWSISVSFGYLVLGEDNGVRVFALRPLVKGRVGKRGRGDKNMNGRLLDNEKSEGRVLNLPNGAVRGFNDSDDIYGGSAIYLKDEVSDRDGESIGVEGNAIKTCSNGYLEGKINAHCTSTKLRPTKLRQDSGAYFVAFKSKEVECSKSTGLPLMSAKAISIHALSPNKLLILDSVGDLHLLHLSNPVLGSKITFHMRQLTQFMKVQKLAVLPDMSTRTQTVWISDGFYSVHMMAVTDTDSSANENDRNESDEKRMQIAVVQAIFTSEKIQDIIPLAANAILILGQGSIFAYAIS